MSRLPGLAAFSTSVALRAHRALIFRQTGNPASVLSALSYPTLPPPPPDSVNLRFRLAPINPSDVNVLEGVYPSKPPLLTSITPGHHLDQPVYIPGNEGLAEVVQVGHAVQGLQQGDWVIIAAKQPGTWCSAKTVLAADLIKLPKDKLSEVAAATITVNPPTAYLILRDFVDLKEGDWIVQNGANSAVGQAVIQIAARRGLRTINFVRNRPDLDALTARLTHLGATRIFTYDALNDREFLKSVKELTADAPPRLLLNCVSGPATAQMTRLLGHDARLVSYGAMSRQPLALPTGALIFRGLRAEGFWLSGWYAAHTRGEREALMREVVDMQLEEPLCEVEELGAGMSDEDAGRRAREVMERVVEGKYGRKVLWRIEDPHE